MGVYAEGILATIEQVHRLAVSDTVATIAQYLQETLGQRLVAYAIGVSDPKAIGKYAGGRQPRTDTEARLRDLYRVTRLMLSEEQPATVRAWMIGSNPQLADQAPIEVLHHGDIPAVLRAAEAFLLSG
jgi:hypothetical protein